MSKFIANLKAQTQKQRAEKEYTPDSRLSLLNKMLHVQVPRANNPEKQESLLINALDIAHPLKFQCKERQPEMNIIIEQILIVLINVLEQQNKIAEEYYQTLEAINENLYTIIYWKIRNLDISMSQPCIMRYKVKYLEKQLNKLLNTEINRVYIQEKQFVEFVQLRIELQLQQKLQRRFTATVILSSYAIMLIWLRKYQLTFSKLVYWKRFTIISVVTSIALSYLYAKY